LKTLALKVLEGWFLVENESRRGALSNARVKSKNCRLIPKSAANYCGYNLAHLSNFWCFSNSIQKILRNHFISIHLISNIIICSIRAYYPLQISKIDFSCMSKYSLLNMISFCYFLTLALNDWLHKSPSIQEYLSYSCNQRT
jgi:hypothetical protein